MTFLYFAYGSNMSLAQMAGRCPGSMRLGIGLLRDHALVFPRFSTRRKCGVAGIERRPGSHVWGVVYRLTSADLPKLDLCEGFDPDRPRHLNNYNRVEATIHLAPGESETAACLTYAAVRQPGAFLPGEDYLATMITGAVENGLPFSYIEELRGLRVADPSAMDGNDAAETFTKILL